MKTEPPLNSCRSQKSANWAAGEIGSILQFITSVWFQQCKIRFPFIQILSLRILVNERDIEPIVMRKANQVISFKFGDCQLLDLMNFLGGVTGLDSFLKAYKTSETKRIFLTKWFDHSGKMEHTQVPPFDAFYSFFAAVTLLKANTRTMLTYWKLNNHRKSPYRIETIKATPYWDWFLSIPAAILSKKKKHIQRLFALA